MPKLLILTFIVSAGVGVFEVGLALRGKQRAHCRDFLEVEFAFAELGRVDADGDAEQIGELILEPEAGRRPAKHVIPLGKSPLSGPVPLLPPRNEEYKSEAAPLRAVS